MAKNLNQLIKQRQQIDKLIAAQERAKHGHISRIKKDIKQLNLTAQDLFGDLSSAPLAEPSAKAKRKVKYRHPDGMSWSGMGRQPAWLKSAVEAGASLEDFSSVTSASAKRPKPSTKASKGAAKSKLPKKTTAAKKAVGKKAAQAPVRPASRKVAAKKSAAKSPKAEKVNLPKRSESESTEDQR